MIAFLQDLAQTHGGLAMVLGLWGCATLAVWGWERFTNANVEARRK